MGFALPNGAHVYLASEYGKSIPFTAITNAKNAIITVGASSNLAVNDEVHITSAWSGIDNVVARVINVSDNSVTLGNINTTNVNKYPNGGGAGSVRKITTWTELPQITEVANAGGDQNTTQIQFLADDRQRNLNTFKAASSQTYTIAHDSSLPVYDLLRKLDDNGDTVAAYMFVPKAKENRYWSASISFNDIPNTAVNNIETVSVVLQLQSRAMTFYKLPDTSAIPGS